jgi:ParB family chromosome partitioning protein
LLGLAGGAQQIAAASRVVVEGLSVRDTERMVHATLHPTSHKKRRDSAVANGDVARLETEIADALGARVRIEPTNKGGGRIVISYSTLDQLDGILAKLK